MAITAENARENQKLSRAKFLMNRAKINARAAEFIAAKLAPVPVSTSSIESSMILHETSTREVTILKEHLEAIDNDRPEPGDSKGLSMWSKARESIAAQLWIAEHGARPGVARPRSKRAFTLSEPQSLDPVEAMEVPARVVSVPSLDDQSGLSHE